MILMTHASSSLEYNNGNPSLRQLVHYQFPQDDKHSSLCPIIIIYIRSHMHLSYHSTPVSLTLSLSTDGEQPQSMAFFAQQHYSCCKASYLDKAQTFTDAHTLWEIKEMKIKIVWVTESTGRRASRERGKLKRPTVSRTSIVQLLY